MVEACLWKNHDYLVIVVNVQFCNHVLFYIFSVQINRLFGNILYFLYLITRVMELDCLLCAKCCFLQACRQKDSTDEHTADNPDPSHT